MMPIERPYPGQLWKCDATQVIIVAVSPTTVTYEDLSGAKGATRESLKDFLAQFRRLRR